MKMLAEGITVRHAGAPTDALVDLSMSLSAGEVVAIVGPNGSGKSTLMRALLGLLPLVTGRVSLDGRLISAWSRRELAEVVGALPQREEPAFPITVAELVLLGRWSRIGPLAGVSAIDRAAASTALARCDVAGLESRLVDTLSGGEWQRVRVARALVASPRLLLLDEPTSALDVGHEMELFELFRRLAMEGLGVLIITHHLNLAARFADRLLLLDEGRTVAEGSPDCVLNADTLASVFHWPVAVTQLPDGARQVVPLRRPHAVDRNTHTSPSTQDSRS